MKVFFGFGPYETKLFNNYKNHDYATGGKVFQNNHWNDEFQKTTQGNQDRYDKPREKFKDMPLPRIPQHQDDKDIFAYSHEHCLTIMRPLKTFQKHQSEVIAISENQYKEIGKSILFQTLLTSDKTRIYSQIFGDKKMNLKIIR